MKLSATVKEAVADAEVEISQEEAAEARLGVWYCSEPRLAFNRTVVLVFILNNGTTRLPPSTFGLPRFDAWRTRLPMPVS